ncbi:MAG: hypothetical protein AAF135_23680 [Bacteroidota bacterium]
MESRYEDLILNPEVVMRKVIRFVDEKWEDKIAVFEGKQGDYEKVYQLTGRESSTLQRLKQPMTRDRIGIWKSKVSSDELNLIREEIKRRGLIEQFDSLYFSKQNKDT